MVGGVQHHAAAPALLEHRGAGLRQRHPGAGVDPEAVGQRGVAHRLAEVAEPQLEQHVEHDVAGEVPLKALVR